MNPYDTERNRNRNRMIGQLVLALVGLGVLRMILMGLNIVG